MSFRWFITNVLLVAQAIAFLVHLSLIAYYGRVLIQEPNPVILILEIALFLGICVLGGANIEKGVRRVKDDKRRL